MRRPGSDRGAVNSGWTKAIGDIQASSMLSYSTTSAASLMLSSIGCSFATLVDAVLGELGLVVCPSFLLILCPSRRDEGNV